MKTHHKIAGIIIKDRKLLMCRKYDEPHFIMPGGKIEKFETPEKTLKRELKEEINVDLNSAAYFRTFATQHFKEKDKVVIMDLYFAEIRGVPQATKEINEMVWLDSNYKQKEISLASINQDFLIPESGKPWRLGFLDAQKCSL